MDIVVIDSDSDSSVNEAGNTLWTTSNVKKKKKSIKCIDLSSFMTESKRPGTEINATVVASNIRKKKKKLFLLTKPSLSYPP